MKNKLKSFAVLLLIALLLLPSMLLPATAEAPQTVRFAANAVSAKKGETITLPIVISSNSKIKLGGLSLYIRYKTDCLSFIEGSAGAVPEEMQGSITSNKNGKLSFVWMSDTAIELSKNTVLLRPQFEVLDTAVETADAEIVIDEVYTYTGSAGTDIVDLAVESNNVNITITIASDDEQINNVINLINAIGTVTYDDQCLNRIIAAATAYSLLNENQKKSVTNYSVLSEAMVEYERLKLLEEESAVNTEVSNYMETHIKALGLTIDSVTVDDEAAVKAAINDYGALSNDAKYQLYKYNKSLNSLLEQIAKLKKAEEDRKAAEEEEARLRAEAQQYAADFREENAQFLSLDPDSLVSDHYKGLNNALQTLSMLEGVNPYVSEYLKSEKIVLTALLEKVKIIMESEGEGETTEMASAAIFRNNFAYVLSLNAQTLTADDKLDVLIAMATYEMLDSDVQALLADEYSVLTELVAALDSLPDEDSEDTDIGEGTETEIQTEEKIVYIKTGGSLGNILTRLNNRVIGSAVWILLMLFTLSAAVLVFLQLFYRLYCKRRPVTADDSGKEASV